MAQKRILAKMGKKLKKYFYTIILDNLLSIIYLWIIQKIVLTVNNSDKFIYIKLLLTKRAFSRTPLFKYNKIK